MVEALAELGKIGFVHRVSLYCLQAEGRLHRCGMWQAAWLSTDPDRVPDENFPFSMEQLERWQDVVTQFGALIARTEEFPEDEITSLRQQSVQSMVVLPIRADDRYLGALRLDDCSGDHDWLPEEIATLQTAADVLSAVIQQRASEQTGSRQRAMVDALLDTAEALTSTLDLGEVLEQILENVGRVVPHDTAGILLVENGVARVVGNQGYAEHGFDVKEMAIRFNVDDVGNLREMARTGQPMVIDDVHDSPYWVRLEITDWLHAYVGAPIHIQGRLVGFLGLNSVQIGIYTPEDAYRLRAFANQAAIAIQNARLYGEARQRSRQISAINRMLHFAISASTLNEMLEILVEQLPLPFNANRAQLVLWDEEISEGREFLFVSGGKQRRIQPEESIKESPDTEMISALRNGRLLIIEDTRDSDRLSAQVVNRIPARAILALPLWTGGAHIGAAVILFDQPQTFGAGEIALAEMAANQVTLAIVKGQLLETVKRSAVTDELTGMLNRRGLFEVGEREVKIAHRLKMELSALMIDLDHFKPVNDTHGHLVGDEVLVELATRLRAGTREIDVLTRYGGDEFFLLLLNCDAQVATRVAERILKSVTGRPFATSAGDMVVTCSIGVATLTPDMDHLSALLEGADTALYQAKNSGRNQIARLPEDDWGGTGL